MHPQFTPAVEKRFWAKVDKNGPIFIDRHGVNHGPCWPWIASTNRRGYGKFHPGGGRTVGWMHASRYSYMLAFGVIPDNLMVLHRCDNPPCVNPNHLFRGDAGDNIRDARDKGRWTPARGEKSVRAKLTADMVRDARLRYRQGEPTGSLAERFGVRSCTMSSIIHGRIWAHEPFAQPVDYSRGGLPGESHPMAKLTEEQVREMRAAWAEGVKAKDLAMRYPVSLKTIQHIVAGRKWKYLT